MHTIICMLLEGGIRLYEIYQRSNSFSQKNMARDIKCMFKVQ